MKQLKTLLIAAVLVLGASQMANAQAKSAHIDVSELMTKMPAYIDAQKQLQKLSETYDADFKTMVAEYQTKLKKYSEEATAPGITDKINEERSKEVQDMEKRIGEFRETAQKELSTKESDLMKPIEEKVKAAIQKVGKAKGYQYVFNAAGLLLADGPDLTVDVKKELGF
ncbi:MAG: OmpH family outer membrane protein [Flavobacterium sp.]|nr:OmpH family outer membrane protein [Flavobacterium sp.]